MHFNGARYAEGENLEIYLIHSFLLSKALEKSCLFLQALLVEQGLTVC